MSIYFRHTTLLSAAGRGVKAHVQNLFAGRTALKKNPDGVVAGELPEADIRAFEQYGKKIGRSGLDPTFLLGAFVAHSLREETPHIDPHSCAVICGSSRGAVFGLEQEVRRFEATGKVSALASPNTTASSFATVVAQELGLRGPALYLSAACATSHQQLLVAKSLLESGVCRQVLVVASECCLSATVIKMFQNLGLYGGKKSALFPCRPFHPERDGMVFGAGAAALLLEAEKPTHGPYGEILALQSSVEKTTATGVTPKCHGLQEVIRQMLKTEGVHPSDIGLVMPHGTGTIQGDGEEWAAYQEIFAGNLPPFVPTKWLHGHVLGASGLFSLILGSALLAQREFPQIPYLEDHLTQTPTGIQKNLALVSGLGFGGINAALLLRMHQP